MLIRDMQFAGRPRFRMKHPDGDGGGGGGGQGDGNKGGAGGAGDGKGGAGDGKGGQGAPGFTQAQVDAIVARETAGLISKRDELLGKLKGFGELDPAAVKDAVAFKAKLEEDRKRKEGEFDTWRAEEQKAREKERADFTTKLTARETRLASLAVRVGIDEAVAAERGIPKMLIPELRQYIRAKGVDADEGDVTLEVIDTKGQVRRNEKGDPMTVRELVALYRKDKEWAGAFLAADTSGSNGRAGNEQGAGGNIRVSRKESRTNPQLYRDAAEKAKKLGVQVEFIDDV